MRAIVLFLSMQTGPYDIGVIGLKTSLPQLVARQSLATGREYGMLLPL